MSVDGPCSKIIKNFKMVTAEHEPKHGALPSTEPAQLPIIAQPGSWPGCRSESQDFDHFYIGVLFFFLIFPSSLYSKHIDILPHSVQKSFFPASVCFAGTECITEGPLILRGAGGEAGNLRMAPVLVEKPRSAAPCLSFKVTQASITLFSLSAHTAPASQFILCDVTPFVVCL